MARAQKIKIILTIPTSGEKLAPLLFLKHRKGIDTETK